MADLSITAANVRMTANNPSVVSNLLAGETITQGQPIRVTDNVVYRADATSQANALVNGIAVTAATSGNLISYVGNGDLTIGATLTAKTLYVLSANAGGIAPYADLVVGNWVTLLGIPKEGTVILSLNIISKPFQIT